MTRVLVIHRTSPHGPVFAGRGPVCDGRGQVFDGRGPVFDGRGPVFAGRGPVFAGRGPVFDGRGPVSAGRGPVFVTVTQRAGSSRDSASVSHPGVTGQGREATPPWTRCDKTLK